MAMSKRVMGLMLLGSWCAACGGGGLGQPVAQFPSRVDLEEVAAAPAKPYPAEQVLTVDRWELGVRAPAAGAEYPSERVWDKFLLGVAEAGPKLAPSPELRCAADEAARFYVEHGAFPDDGLRRYIIARCGATLPSVASQSVTFEIGDEKSEADVEALAKPNLARLKEQLRAAQGHIGLGFARGKGRGSIVIFRGEALGTLEGFSPLVQGDEVVLSGRLRSERGAALALVTEGRYGVVPCEPDRREVYPKFKVHCPIAKDDAQATIEMMTQMPERVLADAVMRVMVRRAEDAGLVYEATSYTDGVAGTERATEPTAAGGANFRTELLGALNEVRRRAKVAPFQLEGAQTEFNSKLTPHFFAASYSRDQTTCDLMALGALAGWDVNGNIRDGGVYAAAQPSTQDAARWLNTALESPMARSALLDGGMSRIAIGSTPIDPSGVMALVTTYAFFESNDHSADEDAVFSEIAKRRAARDLPAPRRHQRGKDMNEALSNIAQNELTSDDALQTALTKVAAVAGVPMSGRVIETSNLELLPMDDALLGDGNLDIEVGITHYKAPGAAWAQYVVLFMYTSSAGEDSGRRASLD